MLNFEGIGTIGDIRIDQFDHLRTSIMTFNNYTKDDKEVTNAEFWDLTLSGEAKESLKDCKKGDTIKLSGLLKNSYKEATQTTYYNLIAIQGEKIDPVPKKEMHLFVKGIGKVGDIKEKGNALSTTMMTYEKITPQNGLVNYKNMFWNLTLTGKSKEALKGCKKGDLIEIKKARLSNSYSEKLKKTFCNIGVYVAKKYDPALNEKKNPEKEPEKKQAKSR